MRLRNFQSFLMHTSYVKIDSTCHIPLDLFLAKSSGYAAR